MSKMMMKKQRNNHNEPIAVICGSSSSDEQRIIAVGDQQQHPLHSHLIQMTSQSGSPAYETNTKQLHQDDRVIEDDSCNYNPLVLAPPKVHLLRPIAMRPADAAGFYKQAQSLKLSLDTVHAAVQESHAWHRQWTTEAGRLEALQQQNVREPERCRNPSPMVLEEEEETATSLRNGVGGTNQHHGKRHRGESVLALNLKEEQDPPQPQALLRPQARRIVVKAAIAGPYAVDDSEHDVVPSSGCGSDNHAIPSTIRSHPSHIDAPDHPTTDGAAKDRPISPLTLDADLLEDDDILQTAEPARLEGRDVQAVVIEDDDVSCCSAALMDNEKVVSTIDDTSPTALAKAARETVLQELAVTSGETSSAALQSAIQVLVQTDCSHVSHTGMWLTLTKPTFFDCLGDNDRGDPLYTLGRMSFGLCAPTSLVCSLQGNFNSVERVVEDKQHILVPKSLREEMMAGSVLETYNIITAFTIEPQSPAFPDAPNQDVQRPIRGLMTTTGYMVPDPLTPNRNTVWITGGRLEPNDCPQDVADWKALFAAHPPQHSFGEKAKLLAVQWLMGATLPTVVDESTGAFAYSFERPLGGHGMTYMDTLYADESLRILKGHRGTTYVFARTSH